MSNGPSSTTKKEMGGEHAPAHGAHGDGAHGESAPYAPVFVGKRKAQLEELFTRYPTKMATLLPALWMVQEDRGWVSADAMAEVESFLAEIDGRGGGKNDMAQGGGSRPEGIPAAIDALRATVASGSE